MAHKKLHSSILYGMAGIIAVAVSIILLLQYKADDLGGYFKGVQKVQLVSAGADGRWLPGGRVSALNGIVLKNQDDSIVDLVNDKHDFKLIAVTSLSSKCKGVIESMSMVKKGLAKYISIEAFAVLGDSITNPKDLDAYLASNNFDVQCLYARKFDEVFRLSKYQLSLVIDREKINGVQDILSDNHILLVHAGKAYFFNGISTSAQEITYAILNNFAGDAGKVAIGAKRELLGKSSYIAIAANAKRMELTRQFDYDCGGTKAPGLACR